MPVSCTSPTYNLLESVLARILKEKKKNSDKNHALARVLLAYVYHVMPQSSYVSADLEKSFSRKN